MTNALLEPVQLSSDEILRVLVFLASYRQGMPVTELVVFPSGHSKTGYYRCPRCRITMEREFMSYCDRCGQHLSWKGYRKARKVYPGQH